MLSRRCLNLAQVTPKDVVIDLGSGDGRNVIAAAKRGARAIGFEYNPDLVELSRQHARDAGVADKATFVQGDMYKADISQATVLALFLTPEVLDQMRDKFLAMKPGTRIVLNTFPVTDWEPDVTETTGPPCKIWCTAMLVIVPAQVAGTWRMGDGADGPAAGFPVREGHDRHAAGDRTAARRRDHADVRLERIQGAGDCRSHRRNCDDRRPTDAMDRNQKLGALGARGAFGATGALACGYGSFDSGGVLCGGLREPEACSKANAYDSSLSSL